MDQELREKKMQRTQSIIRMLDLFGLDAEQQIRVLGFPEGTRTRILRQHRDNKPFPDDEQIQQRVSILAHISDALRTTYPTNPQMALFWIKQKNRHLDNLRPVEVLGRGSRNDLISVLSLLDCTVHWDQSSIKK
ncbi:MAG: hypothetical protein IEMM0001_1046 [bacterium]|nr:MAG: hypothetical protein IEMM0001_1046 [bacterium]